LVKEMQIEQSVGRPHGFESAKKNSSALEHAVVLFQGRKVERKKASCAASATVSAHVPLGGYALAESELAPSVAFSIGSTSHPNRMGALLALLLGACGL
jgi:hypothetical protein